ncbi:PAS domain S-box protein, partial [Archangium sp.]|uniref:PAS domain S-box protein n=1 Tax=Archangium sp. TaxID=1872627 RepID=UPI002ED9E0FD
MSAPRLDGRILVVDDSEAKRYVVSKTLRMAGMDVVEASTGQEALAAAALQPDVVVLDVRLPDMSGFEVCHQLKASPATAAIPVLYISALLQDEELEARLFEDGADGYIPQPIEPKHLVAQTWALVRMRRAEQARQREREEAQAEQARLQRQLDKEQAQARRLTESGVVGLFYWDLGGSILEANDTFLSMVGYTREDLARGRLDWRRMTPPEWAEQDGHSLAEVRARGVGALSEKQYLRQDGTRVDVIRGVAAFEGEPQQGVTLVVDVTARRQAERRLTQLMGELESSEARLRMALEGASLGMWSYDIATQRHQWDARAKELFGLPPEAPIDVETWRAATHPEDRERVSAAVRRALAGEDGGTFAAEYRTVGLQDGGVLRWLVARGRVLFNAEGRATCFLGTYLDVTGHKQAEQRAAELQATTAAFAHALTPWEVGNALVEHGLKSLEAYAAAVSMVEGDQLRMLSQFGYPDNTLRDYSLVSLHQPVPSSLAVHRGEVIWVQRSDSFEREWPEFSRIVQTSQSRCWMSTPLKDGDRVVGVLGLSFSTPRRFSEQEMAHLESLCRLCAQALARARLFEEERRAKEEARRREKLEQQFL